MPKAFFWCLCKDTDHKPVHSTTFWGPSAGEKSLSKITRIHPAKKEKDEKKNLCVQREQSQLFQFTRQEIVFQREYRSFPPLRKLLTRIRNKPPSVYMARNWRALLEVILNSAGLCPAKKNSRVSDLAIPEVCIISPAFDTSPPCF